jgi:serine/threonine protein kinase
LSDNFVPYLAGFRPGKVLAGYRLEALVGAGGMAVVFRARDERLDRPVALKILEPSRAEDPEFRQRFIAESRAAAKVDDPHIIPVYEADEADGVLFIAMRFVHGGDLRSLLDREGALSAERATAFISPVASALDAAHAAGLVHRDVKPANILVDTRPARPDEVYLSDFGIAKSAVAAEPLTAPGIMMGTPDYSPPEQIDGLDLDGRADQYALACVAYQLLTGMAPFKRDEILAVIAAHLYTPPPSLRARRRDLPGAADKVLTKAMAKAPDQRYESCGDFAEELREALGVAPYRPRFATALASPPLAAPVTPRPATLSGSAGAPAMSPEGDTAPFSMPTVTDVRVPVPAVAPPAAPEAVETPEPPEEPPDPPEPWPSAGRPGLPGLPQLPRMSPRRRRKALGTVKVGVPLAVLAAGVALILVAVTMRSGTPGTATSAAALGSPGCGSAFAGYPGQQGSVAVSSIASSGGTHLAVGSADDRPAIWRCASGAAWKLMSAAAVDTLHGATLSSVAHGPGGWIAVGEGGSGASEYPVAVTSASGASWQPVNGSAAFMGPGACVTAVAADGNGYAVVGNHMTPGRISAAMWSSADSRQWTEDDNDRGGFLDGSQRKSRVNAVAAIPGGFVAVGTHTPGGAIWTSTDGGQQWTMTDSTGSGVPAGALNLVMASGNRIVAAGYAITKSGRDVPVVVVSTDGGLHWDRPVSLATSGGQGGRVTALAVTGSGFVAEGQLGPAGAQRSVAWSSPDGLTWSAASDTSGIEGMTGAGEMVTDASQQCVFM